MSRSKFLCNILVHLSTYFPLIMVLHWIGMTWSHCECVHWVNTRSTKLSIAQESTISMPPNNSERRSSQGDENSEMKHKKRGMDLDPATLGFFPV